MLHNIYNLDKHIALSAPVTDKRAEATPTRHNLALFSMRGRGLLAQLRVKALHPAHV